MERGGVKMDPGWVSVSPVSILASSAINYSIYSSEYDSVSTFWVYFWIVKPLFVNIPTFPDEGVALCLFLGQKWNM